MKSLPVGSNNTMVLTALALACFWLPLNAQTPITADNVATALANGRWDWTVFIRAAPEVISKIRCVEYILDPTYPNRERLVCEKGIQDKPFALNAQGWGEFTIPITIRFNEGVPKTLSYRLQLKNALQSDSSRSARTQTTVVAVRNRLDDADVNRDRSTIAVAYAQGSHDNVELWNVASSHATQLYSLEHIMALRFSVDGTHLFGIGDNAGFFTWELNSPKAPPQYKRLGFRRSILSAFLDSTGAWAETKAVLASGSLAIRLWQVASATSLGELPAHQLAAVSFNGQGSRFATLSRDGSVTLHALPSLVAVRRPIKLGPRARDIDLNSDGGNFALANGSKAQIWDANSGLVIKEISLPSKLKRISLASDERTAAVTGDDNTVYLWEITSSKVTPLHKHRSTVIRLQYSSPSALMSAEEGGSVALHVIPGAK